MKVCSKCKELLEDDNFAFLNIEKNIRQFQCRMCKKEINKKSREKHAKKRELYNKKYRKRDYVIIKDKEYNDKYYKSEKVKKRISEYGKTSSRKKYHTIYNKSDKGKMIMKLSAIKRRALKIQVNENFTASDIEYVFNLFDNKCFNCNSIDNLEIDHHMPLSKGYALSRNNAVILCRSCNARKRNKNPQDYYSNNQIILLEETYNILTHKEI